MRYPLASLTILAWGLWLGGAVALFLMVSHLFSSDRNVAVQAAPMMFVQFARYQIFLAAVALIGAAAWRLREPRAVLTSLFALFALCAVATIVIAAVITPRMEALRERGESRTPHYQRLHGQASMLYVTETALLLVAGFLLPRALRAPLPRNPVSVPAQVEPEVTAAPAPVTETSRG